jgi:hypothetical protein
MDVSKVSNLISTSVDNNAGNFIKYLRENFTAFLKKIPILFKSIVVNSQTMLVSLIVLIILLAITFILYKLYKTHYRPWSTYNFLDIASSQDKNTKNLDNIYYQNLANGLTHYIYPYEFQYYPNLLNGTEAIKKSQLKYINDKIYFHKNSQSYKDLVDFENQYNINITNKKWGIKSIEGIQNFFTDILINRNFKYKTLKNKLIDILTKNKIDFENNLDRVIKDNIYSYINANTYINNKPQNDYILNTYGKFVKIKVDNNTDKYLLEVLNVPNGQLKDMLTYSKENPNDIIISKLNELKSEYDLVCHEPLEQFIFRTINGSPDSSEFIEYKKFLNAYGISGNDFLDTILQLSKIRNNSIDLTLQSKYNIERASSSQKLKIIIYQDIIIYANYLQILKNYQKIITDKNLQHKITTDYNYSLERLTYSKHNSGENITYVFDKSQRDKLLKITSDILDLINYPMYKSEMSYGLFSVIYIYLSNDSIKEKLKSLADYYMCFSELYLGVDALKDFEDLKTKRENINIFKDFFEPAIKYYFVDVIYKKQIKSIIWGNHSDAVKPLWGNIDKKMKSGSTYFNCGDPIIAKVIPVCRQGFENNLDDISKNNKNDIIDNKKDLIEGWNPFAAIIKPFVDMGKFFTKVLQLIGNIFKIVFALVGLITHFDKLLGALAGFFLWIIGTILRIILEIPLGGKQIGQVITSFFYRTLYLLPIAVYNSSIFFILLLMRFILTMIVVILDSLTNRRASKWFYKYFIACETSPFSWFENSFFQLDNKVERDFVCKKTCYDGYKLSEDGSMCEKIPDYIPNYCPSSQLMRIYRGLNVSGSLGLKEFKLPMRLTEKEKEDYINNFKKNKKEYYESCQNLTINKYDNVAKSICSMADFTNNSKVSNSDMQSICYNKYCTNGSHSNFCTKLKNNSFSDNIKDNNKSDFLKTTATYGIIIIILVTCIYTINKKLDIIEKIKQLNDKTI